MLFAQLCAIRIGEEKFLKKGKNKTATAIALLLLLTVSGMMTILSTSKAQTADSPIPTNAYVTVSPKLAVSMIITVFGAILVTTKF